MPASRVARRYHDVLREPQQTVDVEFVQSQILRAHLGQVNVLPNLVALTLAGHLVDATLVQEGILKHRLTPVQERELGMNAPVR
jgi:hypothetical protein